MRSKSTSQQRALSTLPIEAKRLGISVKKLRAAANVGDLPVYSFGRWLRVRPSDVERWVDAHRVRPRDEIRRRVAEARRRMRSGGRRS